MTREVSVRRVTAGSMQRRLTAVHAGLCAHSLATLEALVIGIPLLSALALLLLLLKLLQLLLLRQLRVSGRHRIGVERQHAADLPCHAADRIAKTAIAKHAADRAAH